MDERIKGLEEYRVKHDLSHADIARLVGAGSLQAYNNWRYRNSVPKEYFTVVDGILYGHIKNAHSDLEILEKISGLSDKQKELLDSYLEALVSQ